MVVVVIEGRIVDSFCVVGVVVLVAGAAGNHE